VTGWVWQDQSCPGAAPDLSASEARDSWRFTCTDEDAFFAHLADEYGIQRDWVVFDRVRVGVAAGCAVTDEVDDSCFTFWTGYPVRAQEIEIPNPKDGIDLALDAIKDISEALADASANSFDMFLEFYDSEVIDGSYLPVYMSVESTASMRKVVETADEIEEVERKELILGFLTGILLLVPAVGAAADAIGLAAIGRILTIAASAGNAAFAIYGIVEDPKSAVFLIFSALGVRDFGRAAGIRRSMVSRDITAMGESISASIGKIDGLKKACI